MPNTTPTLAREGGKAFTSYFARPDAGRGAGVLLLHDMFGLHDVIRAVADHFAGLGYAALVPNMFWRSEISGRSPTINMRPPGRGSTRSISMWHRRIWRWRSGSCATSRFALGR